MNPTLIVVSNESHLDHGINAAQREYVLDKVTKGDGTIIAGEHYPSKFLIAQVTLPEEYGKVSCALRGPIVGDDVIGFDDTFLATRKGRPNQSKLTNLPPTKTYTVSVIVIDGVLATMYGGPVAPQEVEDPNIDASNVETSRTFWSMHALSAECFEVER